MISGTGIDLIEVVRFTREHARRAGDRFDDVFTPVELATCEAMPDPVLGYAAGFAAKEACFKAIGTGKVGRMSWHDIEIGRADGRYMVTLGGETAAVAREAGVGRLHLTLTHVEGQIVAWVVAESARAA